MSDGRGRPDDECARLDPDVQFTCPAAGQPVSAGYHLAADTMRVDSSEPVGFRYSWRGWAIRLAPGPSQADVEASTAWVLCLGPGTQAGRAIDVP